MNIGDKLAVWGLASAARNDMAQILGKKGVEAIGEKALNELSGYRTHLTSDVGTIKYNRGFLKGYIVGGCVMWISFVAVDLIDRAIQKHKKKKAEKKLNDQIHLIANGISKAYDEILEEENKEKEECSSKTQQTK